jgi:HAD superfamily hydrolase (TIGR01509 family)
VIRLAIFDHSGVLVDDLRQSWQAISKVVTLRGYKPDSLDAFRRNFQLPYWEYLRLKGFAPRETHDSGIVSEFIRSYSSSMDYVKLFDDVEQTLDRLSQDGVELALVSHSPRPIIETSLKKFNLSRYFKSNCVFAHGDFKRDKPYPDSIEVALKKLGYDATEAFYVGDMREDIRAARGAGVRSIAIYREGGSYHTDAMLVAEKPDFLIHRLTEVGSMTR